LRFSLVYESRRVALEVAPAEVLAFPADPADDPELAFPADPGLAFPEYPVLALPADPVPADAVLVFPRDPASALAD
jgi:hypothetical protein